VSRLLDYWGEILEAARAAARVAQNTEAERKAVEIRVRAERRAGELLAEIQRGKTGPKLPATAAGNSDYRRELGAAIARLEATCEALAGARTLLGCELLRHYRALADEARAERARRQVR